MRIEVARRVLGQAAPAAADLEHALARLHAAFVQRAPHLGPLRLRQVTAQVALEPGGRVAHRLVQPQLVERVAQVVVGMDVLAAAAARVAVQQVLDAVQQRAPPAAVDGRFDRLAVGDEDLQQFHQVGRAPVLVDETFGKADVAAAQRGAADLPVAQPHRAARLVLGAAAEVHLRAVGQLQIERAAAQLAQQAEGGARGSGRRLGQGQGRGGGAAAHGGGESKDSTSDEALGRCRLLDVGHALEPYA